RRCWRSRSTATQTITPPGSGHATTGPLPVPLRAARSRVPAGAAPRAHGAGTELDGAPSARAQAGSQAAA
ncbi:unnamed protein product, partial [Prorocentrum cordatum]